MDISRRAFLGSAGAVVVADPVEPARVVRLDRPTLPVPRHSEIVVAGGSFAGVSAALAFARAGRKVVLVEPRTYLGRELTATLSSARTPSETESRSGNGLQRAILSVHVGPAALPHRSATLLPDGMHRLLRPGSAASPGGTPVVRNNVVRPC